MLFNSYEFLFIYLPIVFLGYFVFAHKNKRFAATWLVLASLFFYGWWNPKYVLLLLASIAFNFCAGVAISKNTLDAKGKTILTVSVVANLALLAFFKYTNFFIQTIATAGASFNSIDILLPLGISFFTFTQIAFLVDVYRGKAKEFNAIHYLLFVTWFPHLIAGPVLHHQQMMPQFLRPETYRPNFESISVGITIFAIGLFKKVILADRFALYADPIFDAANSGAPLAFLEAWTGALCYTMQLYFDFSGYSDMAIGLSRIFNIKLPLNFNSPYKSANIIEFWRRWHMTLSSFLRDYLYVPLGGNRKGSIRRYVNLLVTMLLGGLWHGAGWNFVLWGFLHGIYLVVNNLWQSWRKKPSERDLQPQRKQLRRASILLTFLLVVIAWVPFRSTNFTSTFIMIKAMLGGNGLSVSQTLAPYLSSLSVLLGDYLTFSGFAPQTFLPSKSLTFWVPLGLLFVWLFPNTQELLAKFSPAWDKVAHQSKRGWEPTRWCGIVVGLLLALTVLAFKKNSPFLYFQF
jgi:alginate O-acetyltransferase complex protein AlgI